MKHKLKNAPISPWQPCFAQMERACHLGETKTEQSAYHALYDKTKGISSLWQPRFAQMERNSDNSYTIQQSVLVPQCHKKEAIPSTLSWQLRLAQMERESTKNLPTKNLPAKNLPTKNLSSETLLDALPLLAGDRDFVNVRLVGKTKAERQTLLEGYHHAWQIAEKAETISYKKSNRGRHAANTWLREHAGILSNTHTKRADAPT